MTPAGTTSVGPVVKESLTCGGRRRSGDLAAGLHECRLLAREAVQCG